MFNHGAKLDLHPDLGLKHCIMNSIMVWTIVNSLMKNNLTTWSINRIITMISITAIPQTTLSLTTLMTLIQHLKLIMSCPLIGTACREKMNYSTVSAVEIITLISYPNTNDKLSFKTRMCRSKFASLYYYLC